MSSIVAALDGDTNDYPPAPSLDPAWLRRFRNIVLLVIDGLGYRYLTDYGGDGVLRRFLRERMTSVFPPTTAAAIPTFLTGVAPQQHGFTGWFTYFRELGGIVAVLPFRPRCGGSSLASATLNPFALSEQPPIFDRVAADGYTVMPERIAYSDFNAVFSGSASIRPYRTLTQLFTTLQHLLAAGRGRKYIYAYWPDFDALAHVHGIASERVASHFAEIDAAVDRFVAAMAGTDTVLLITADHGFIDCGPDQLIELDDHPTLRDALIMPLSGEPRLAYCYVHPDRRATLEHYVAAELNGCATLVDSAWMLAEGLFGLGAPHPRLHERIGHCALVMKEYFAIKDWVLGEPRYRHIGVHGGVSFDEMYVPLVVIES